MTDETNPKDLLGAKKPPISLVPPSAVVKCAMAMKNGAEKYGAYNWRAKKVQYMIYIDAALRHIFALIDGENEAEDSKLDHKAHAMACLAILIDAEETGNLIDNRPIKGAVNQTLKKYTDQQLSEIATQVEKDQLDDALKDVYEKNASEKSRNYLKSVYPETTWGMDFDGKGCLDINEHLQKMKNKPSKYFYGTEDKKDDK